MFGFQMPDNAYDGLGFAVATVGTNLEKRLQNFSHSEVAVTGGESKIFQPSIIESPSLAQCEIAVPTWGRRNNINYFAVYRQNFLTGVGTWYTVSLPIEWTSYADCIGATVDGDKVNFVFASPTSPYNVAVFGNIDYKTGIMDWSNSSIRVQTGGSTSQAPRVYDSIKISSNLTLWLFKQMTMVLVDTATGKASPVVTPSYGANGWDPSFPQKSGNTVVVYGGDSSSTPTVMKGYKLDCVGGDTPTITIGDSVELNEGIVSSVNLDGKVFGLTTGGVMKAFDFFGSAGPTYTAKTVNRAGLYAIPRPNASLYYYQNYRGFNASSL